MRWRIKSRWVRDEYYVWSIPWHRWFAWHPVRVDNEWVWLEYVERLGVDGDGYGDSWKYRRMRGY